MTTIFLEILNMSITGNYVILFIIAIRFLLKRFPKSLSYMLWLVVAVRLIIPFNFESSLSLLPANINSRPIHKDVIYEQNPEINIGAELVDFYINEKLPAATIEASANPLQIYIELASYVWLMGLLTNPISKKDETKTVENLWEGRTDYIGDNSAVANLVHLLPVPDGLEYDHIQLYTDERPYGVEIVYNVSSENIKGSNEKADDIFEKNALMLLALIENADQVKVIIMEDEEDSSLSFKSYNFELEWANKTVDGNIKDYSESPEKLKELMN